MGVPRRVLLASCVIGATGMLLLGHAPSAAVGIAGATSITVALTLSAALLTTAALVVGRSRAGRAPTTDHGAEHVPGRVA